MINCMFCSAENEEGRRFCVECNARFPERGLGERTHSISIGEESDLNLPDEHYFDENLQVLAWSVFDLLQPATVEEEQAVEEELEETGDFAGVDYEAMFEAFERFAEEYEEFRSKRAGLEEKLNSLRLPETSSVDNLLYLLTQSIEQYDRGSAEFDAFFEALEKDQEFDVERLRAAIKDLMGAHNYRAEMVGMSIVFSETCFDAAMGILKDVESPEEQVRCVEALHASLEEQGFEIPEEAQRGLERARSEAAKGS